MQTVVRQKIIKFVNNISNFPNENEALFGDTGMIVDKTVIEKTVHCKLIHRTTHAEWYKV